MKKQSIPLIVVLGGVLILFLYAVSSTPRLSTYAMGETTVTPLIPPGPKPTDRVPPDKTYYRKRCWPACHYSPGWISKDPVRDTMDFDGTLGNYWDWENGEPLHWSITDQPGALRIFSQGEANLWDTRNVLMRDVPVVEFFDLVTKLDFEPVTSSQEAGIFIQFDNDHYISLSRGYCDEDTDAHCSESGVFFDGAEFGCEREGFSVPSGTINLMLRQAGNSYIGYYSQGESLEPEAPWVEVARCYAPELTPVQAGLSVTNGENADATEIPVDFDLVRIVERK